MTSDPRTDEIVHRLETNFASLIARDSPAFRHRFRKMAADPFAFYRGSACLFYADLAAGPDPWVDDQTSRVWVHGDLHAENFGTYLDGRGMLVFDVNDFDEAYLGHYTWDVLRCAVSLALLGWRKAFPDEVIAAIVGAYVRSYVDQVHSYVEWTDDRSWSLRLDNAEGPVADTLHAARNASRVALLSKNTVVTEGERHFSDGRGQRRLGDAEKDRVLAAYEHYLETIPPAKRFADKLTYHVKDIVGASGFGIGSAGLAAYNILIEGRSQALENDVVLSLKEGNVAAPSAVVDDERLADAFIHHGHRTALSQRALQAHTDPLLGWTEIDGAGFVVRELSPYEADLSWEDLTEPADIERLIVDLGRATAKVHCVADADAEAIVVQAQVEDLITATLDGREDEFVSYVQDFALRYAASTRDDHRRFVDAFRAGAFKSVSAT